MAILQTYSTNLNVNENDTIQLINNPVMTAGVERSSATVISLRKPGLYHVSVNATGTTTDAGTFGIQMSASGTDAPDALASTTTTADAVASVSFETLVEVRAASNSSNAVPISFIYTGSAGNISLVNVIIEKVG
jgi:hypothetical protein